MSDKETLTIYIEERRGKGRVKKRLSRYCRMILGRHRR